MKKEIIGFTTTIPVEILLAAGKVPVDLNNIFINSPEPAKLIQQAEYAGFPSNLCSWIKGLYGAVHQFNIKKVIAVTQGDCSNTQALMEIFESEGIEIIPFAYPYDRDYGMLRLQMEKLMNYFEVDLAEVEKVRQRLLPLRNMLKVIDELTYKTGQCSGLENHYYLVSASDFKSDVQPFSQEVKEFLKRIKKSPAASKDSIRLGYIGVPPIMNDIYQFLESQGVAVVYNELARQFAMLTDYGDIISQYQNYTYPYKVFYRLEDIKAAIKERKLQGLIHYTQSFCFRQIEDIIIRQQVDIPVLTIEGNTPGPLDGRTRLRLESFCEMLKPVGLF